MESDIRVELSAVDLTDFYNTRRLKYCPPHFIVVSCPTKSIGAIEDWIYNNTEGRFATLTRTTSRPDNKLIYQHTAVGFELEQEALLFTLTFI